MTARVITTVLTIAAIAVIFYNSSLDAVISTQQSSPLTDWINSFLGDMKIGLSVTENFIRKTAHFTEYSVLGALMSTTVYLYRHKRLKTFLTALFLGAVVAVCDELIQLTSAGRSCQVSDMLLDTCGVLFGTLIVTGIISILEKRRSQKMKEG